MTFRPKRKQVMLALLPFLISMAFVLYTAVTSEHVLTGSPWYLPVIGLTCAITLFEPLRLALSRLDLTENALVVHGFGKSLRFLFTDIQEVAVVPRVPRILLRFTNGEWQLLPRWVATDANVVAEISRSLRP